MKRFIFSVCALAAVVVGCTKSEVINRPHAEEPIQFNPYTGRIPVTKGTAADIDSLGQFGFQVYAFIHDGNNSGDNSEIYDTKPYMDKIVTRQNSVWTYPGKAYWPGQSKLNFIAYGLNTGKLLSTTEQEHMVNYTVPDTVAYQRDLLVAKYQPNMQYDEKTENGTVDFTFSHLLSRIGFSLVTKEDGTLVSIEQIDMKGNFYRTGEVNLAHAESYSLKIGDTTIVANRPVIKPTGTLADITYSLLPIHDADTASFSSLGSVDGAPIYDNSMLYVKNYNNTHTPNDDLYEAKASPSAAETEQELKNQSNRYMMIIPVKGADHKAKLNVKYFLPNAGTFSPTKPIDLSGVDFEPGKSYNFKLKVSTNGISFSVDVEQWDVTGEARDEIVLN